MSDNEILKEFLDESHENLDELDRHVVALEHDPSRQELLASAFRTIHTIKGTSAFLRFSKLEMLSHAGETLLGKLRQGDLRWGPKSASAILALGDATRALLANIRASGVEGDTDYGALILRLGAVTHEEAPAEAILVPAGVQEAVAASVERAGGAADGRLRVDVGLLDRLMNLVGELVLARNEIAQLAANQGDPAFHRASTHLSALATQLQHGVMQTRMQPIGHLWGKLPRLVRDLAETCGKQLRLELHGEETELDKALLEAIRDPLTHLLRNAIDHGIEAPDDRARAGKNPEGRLALRAFHEGGILIIEVSDDGAGIDTARVQERARERGLVGGDKARPLTETEIAQFLFSPGFSTKADVGRLSGRGVGLDVVKTAIERIGGSVSVEAQMGRGATFRISLPLTLAIISALMITCDGDSYAIPLSAVLEVLRFESGTERAIESVNGAPVIRLRGKLLPLLTLADELGIAPRALASSEAISVVVLQAEGRRFGVVVDEIKDAGEIVVRSLPTALKTRACFAGATIRQDGAVALIVDVLAFARRAALISDLREPVVEAPVPADGPKAQSLLLVEGPGGARLAIALTAVRRLLELPATAIERSGGEEVVQHRGEIVSLTRLSSLLVERRGKARTTSGPPPDGSVLHVVVVDSDRGVVGVVVERIVEIIEARLSVTRPPSRPGVQCSAVILDRVTELLHLPTLLRATTSPIEAP